MERIPIRVKGVYLSAYVAGNESMVDEIIEKIDQTEINAVVIDVKDDEGKSDLFHGFSYGDRTGILWRLKFRICRRL